MQVTMWTSDRIHIQTASKLIDFILGEIDTIDMVEIRVECTRLKRIRDRLNKIDSQARTCQVPPGREEIT